MRLDRRHRQDPCPPPSSSPSTCFQWVSDSLKSFGAQSENAQTLLYVGLSSEEETMPFSNPRP